MRVLLADDDRLSRTLLSRQLQRADFDVVEAQDGATARDLLLGDPSIRVALLDWVMPGLDGPEVCRAIREHEGDGYRYLVLLTARDGRDDYVSGLEAGADDFVQKPVDPPRLLARLRVARRIVSASDELACSRAQLLAVLSSIDEGVALTDPSGRLAFSNQALATLSGTPVHAAPNGQGERRDEWVRRFATTVRSPQVAVSEDGPDRVEVLTTTGRVIEWSMRDVPLGGGTGRLDLLRDVTDVRALAAALRAQALEDSLTGLVNRRGGEQALGRENARVQRHGSSFGVLLVDIDHFKRVNDTFGHATGDEVLRRVASVLRRTIRPYDIAARWGGEEFLVILPGASLEQACGVAERVRRAIERAEGEPCVTASIGVAASSAGDHHVASVLERADRALYRAKGDGRNRAVRALGPEAAAGQ